MVQRMRKMKDSGIEWIGEIPEGWEVGQIGQLYSERRTKVSDKDYPPLSVTMKGILPQLSTAAKTDAHDDRKLVCKGDFAINSRSDRRGSCGISEQDGSISLINTVLQPRGEMNPGYYNWLFHTSMFADEFYKWGHGIVDDLWTTGWSDMKKIGVPVPSKCEQKQLAEHLNFECSNIDTILSKTRSSIEEYKKLKQAVITQAVTKGVRGEREMKDSGNPWFGQIPTDWKLSRVGLHFSIILGKMLCNAPLNDTYTLEPYYCAADVHFDGVADGERKKMWFSPIEKDLYRVSVGDLLVVEGGAGAGGSAIVENQDSYTYIQNSIMIVRSKGNTDSRYLRYLLEFLVKQGYIDIVCNKATIPHFTKDKLSCVPFCLCPTGEQKEIADYLDAKCAEIDRLIAKKEQLVKELEGYKKSLIYEVVTGKREV
jgi:type I restriction enzyme S subunit